MSSLLAYNRCSQRLLVAVADNHDGKLLLVISNNITAIRIIIGLEAGNAGRIDFLPAFPVYYPLIVHVGSADELEYALTGLVRLREHRSTGLRKDLVLREVDHCSPPDKPECVP